jgi:hypothetical protein
MEMGTDSFHSDSLNDSSKQNGQLLNSNGHVADEAPPPAAASPIEVVSPAAPPLEKPEPAVDPSVLKAVDDVLYSDVRRTFPCL